MRINESRSNQTKRVQVKSLKIINESKCYLYFDNSMSSRTVSAAQDSMRTRVLITNEKCRKHSYFRNIFRSSESFNNLDQFKTQSCFACRLGFFAYLKQLKEVLTTHRINSLNNHFICVACIRIHNGKKTVVTDDVLVHLNYIYEFGPPMV